MTSILLTKLHHDQINNYYQHYYYYYYLPSRVSQAGVFQL